MVESSKHISLFAITMQVRKLEFLLAEAAVQGHDCVITIGGIQSNHCRATAVAARYMHDRHLCCPRYNPYYVLDLSCTHVRVAIIMTPNHGCNAHARQQMIACAMTWKQVPDVHQCHRQIT